MTIRHPSAICQCHWVKWFLWHNSYITSTTVANSKYKFAMQTKCDIYHKTNIKPKRCLSTYKCQSIFTFFGAFKTITCIAYVHCISDTMTGLAFLIWICICGYKKHLNFNISTWYVKAATAKRVFLPNILCNIGQHN